MFIVPAVIRSHPPVDERLASLAKAAQHDLSCACGPHEPRQRGADGLWIYPAALPSGERVPLLKVLQTSGCERGCSYCSERLGGSGRRAALTPEELAGAYVELFRRRRVFGLFLSSAIQRGSVATMDRMLATCEILRRKYRYRGYLHLKIIPGSQPSQVVQAMALATRVSINMEAPSAAHLARIAPEKQFDDQILAPMMQVARAQAGGSFGRLGQTTQLVVGAADETDQDIASATAWLYRKLHLARVYYSSLQPIPGGPLAQRSPVPFLREHRLYQVDFLLRRYGFELDEIIFDNSGFLPLDGDPKTVWARRHPERFPVEVNTASKEELVRIPGIGPQSAERLIAMRRNGCLRSIDALRTAGTSWRVAAPYVLLAGRHLPAQLSLFA